MRQISGVRQAGLGFPLPLDATQLFEPIAAQAGAETQTVSASIALPGFLESLEIPLRSGRYFDRTDLRRDIFPVILDEALARQLFGTSDVLGQRLYVRRRQAEVIGVTGPIRNVTLRSDPGFHIWCPMPCAPSPGCHWLCEAMAIRCGWLGR